MPGTPKVGYMGPENGPFSCSRCKHYETTGDGSGCNQIEVIAELGAGKAGLAAVDPQGCCNEFEPQKRDKDGIGSSMLAMIRKKKATK